MRPTTRKALRAAALLLAAGVAVGVGLAAWMSTGGAAADDGDLLEIAERQGLANNREPEAVPGELIVRFAPSAAGVAGKAALAEAGAVLKRDLRLSGYSVVRVPAGRETEFAERLLYAAGVETVEPNWIYRYSFTPDDPGYPYQWHLADIGMPTA